MSLASQVKAEVKYVLAINGVKPVLHTFWQGFIGVFLIGAPLVEHAFKIGGLGAGKTALVSLLTAAVMAGLSALKSSSSRLYQSYKANKLSEALASQTEQSQPPTLPTPTAVASPQPEDMSQPTPPVSTAL